MSERDFYSRNFPYVPKELQDRLSSPVVGIFGAGMGSKIAETLLRTGFDNLLIVDGDTVALSNLNRQNYTAGDVGKNKSRVICDYLKLIKPDARIRFAEEFINESNIESYIDQVDFVINTIDFEAGEVHLMCNRISKQKRKPVVYPVNNGWGAVTFVFTTESPTMDDLLQRHPGEEPITATALHLLEFLIERDRMPTWLPDVWEKFYNKELDYEPQMCPGCDSASATVAALLYNMVAGLPFPVFPQPVYHDHRDFKPPARSLFGWFKKHAMRRLLRRRKVYS